MADRVFEFSVDDKGNFKYTPSEDWLYCSFDKLRIQTLDGPFTLKLRRTDTSPGRGPVTNPLGEEMLESTKPPGSQHWIIDVIEIRDGLTPAQRKEIFRANFPPGFIAKYRYLIGVLKNGKAMADDDQFGTYSC
jgi:hypothetical protein